MAALRPLLAATLGLTLAACGPGGAPPADNGKVAVLLTGWGEPVGMSEDYRRDINRARAGKRRDYPFQPCTDMYAGRWPFASQIGLLPFAISHPLPVLGGAYDSLGVYRYDAASDSYTALLDPSVTLAAADIPAIEGIVQPASAFRGFPARSVGGIDPRDGRNLLEGIYVIGAGSRERGPNPKAVPNGLGDVYEISQAAALADMGFMYDDLTPRGNPADDAIHADVAARLRALFGEQVTVAYGAYAATPGLHRAQEDVAIELVAKGHRRLVLARETTDNNHYANTFMTGGLIRHALCEQGYLDDIEIAQTRQVGRTPEYNTALLEILRPHLEAVPAGNEVAIIYTTYGMPFPGSSDSGPFGVAHPLAADPYHENAYLNYQSFKRYAEAAFGARNPLAFNRAGASGDARTDSYYGYAMFPTEYYGAPEDPLRFPTVRESIDQAKADGRREVVVLLSHWNTTNTDTLLGLRRLNRIPYNSREESSAGKTWIDWCELPASHEPVSCDSEGAVHLQYSAVFDDQADAFAEGYSQRLRGTVERFGVRPEGLGIAVAASAPISEREGGTVGVAEGVLAGAALAVPADPAPGAPERFRWDDYEAFVDPARPFVGAWFDFEAYIGSQQAVAAPTGAVSPVALFGPYRTLFNKPARVTLPVSAAAGEALEAVIFNHATGGWDPVYAVAGGAAPEHTAGRYSFDTQVLGLFAVRRSGG